MKLLFLMAMAFSLNTYAKPVNNDFQDATRLWKDFRACQADVKNELKLINCTESFINSKIPRYEKAKLVSLLIMDFSFSELESCDGVKNLLPETPIKGEKYFCMKVLGHTSKLPGYIIVTLEKGQMKLNAIKYNETPAR